MRPRLARASARPLHTVGGYNHSFCLGEYGIILAIELSGLAVLGLSRVGTCCSRLKIFGPPNQSGKIFGRSVEFGLSLVVTNKRN